MKKIFLRLILVIAIIIFFGTVSFCQSNQTVTNGNTTTPVTFNGSGCTYNWTNDNQSIGLPASGTGDIPAFTAKNTGTSPVIGHITVTPVPSSYAYVANYFDNTVTVVNTITNMVNTTIPVGTEPLAVSVSADGKRVYVANIYDATISVIDAAANQVIATIGGVYPEGLVVSPDGSRLFVANMGGTISVIDTATDTIIATITLVSGTYNLAISSDGSRLYVANILTNDVSVINTANNSVIGSNTVGTKPDCIVLSPDNKNAYVANSGSNTISVINTTGNTVSATIPLSFSPGYMCISPDGNELYVTDNNAGKVHIINTSTNSAGAVIAVTGSASGISISADGKMLYVENGYIGLNNNTNSNTVSVINTATNTVAATIPVGSHPIAYGNFVSAGFGCQSNTTSFNITVNPSTTVATITTGPVTGTISACQGAASASPNVQQFTVSGNNLTNAVIIRAPSGFEVSLDGSAYGLSTSLAPISGNLTSATIYVRSAATNAAGVISGNVMLGSAGAASKGVAVSGVVNALPIAGQPGNQTVTAGSTTAAVNFTGSGNMFTWTNDNPGIGLAASGSGNIPAFTAVNPGNTTVTAKITVTSVNEQAGYEYIANETSNKVSVISNITNSVVATIDVGAGPFGMALSPDGSMAYVTNFVGNSVSVINTAENKVVATVSENFNPFGIAVSPDGKMVYVCDSFGMGVIDATTNQAIKTVVFGNYVAGQLTVSPDGKWVYVTDPNNNALIIVNASTYELTRVNIPTNILDAANSVAVSPDGKLIYLSGSNTHNIYVISAATQTIIKTINLSSAALNIALSPDGSRLYVANTYTNTVSVVNTSDGTVAATIPVGSSPGAISVTPDGGTIYVINAGSNNMSVINALTNQVTATIPTGEGSASYGNFIKSTITCSSSPVTFNISVNQATATITATQPTGIISTCQGTASASPDILQFTVKGSNLATAVTATAPSGFEVSLNAASGYSSSVVINPVNGNLASTTIYVRSTAADAAGNIAGNVTLSSTGAADQSVAVSGIINALTTVDQPANQTVTAGSATTAVTFTGTANTCNWTNDSPSIGLSASGTGNIPSFTAINTGPSPVTANITVTPVNPGFAYITSASVFNNGPGDNIKVINTYNNNVVANILVGRGPSCVAVSPDGNKVYISNSIDNTVSVIDTRSNQVIATISVGADPNGIYFSPDGKFAYVSDSDSDAVSVISTATNSVVYTITEDVGDYPVATLVSPDGSRLFVSNSHWQNIKVYSTANYQLLQTIPLAGGWEPRQMAITADGSTLYVATANTVESSVLKINTTTYAVAAPIVTGANIHSIVLTPDGSKLYVADSNGNMVYVINTATNTVIASIPVGNEPAGVSVTADGASVYVTVQGSLNMGPTVTVISTSTNQISGVYPFTGIPESIGNFITPGNPCVGPSQTFGITVNALPSPIVTVTAATGNISACEGTASVSPDIQQFVIIGSNLTASVTATAPAGFEVSLNATSGYGGSVAANPVNGSLSNTTVYIRSAASDVAGNISGNVVISSTGAVNRQVAATGIVNALPVVNQEGNQTLTAGAASAIVGFSGTADTYDWINDTPGIGLAANGTGIVPSFTAINSSTNPIEATITVTPLNNTGCNGTPITFKIQVNPAQTSVVGASAVLIPNTFTPNGDGINDTWDIKNLESYPKATIDIFNRWGQKLYASIGYPVPWDGTNNGKELPVGTYYYLINLKNGQPVIAGWVAIVK